MNTLVPPRAVPVADVPPSMLSVLVVDDDPDVMSFLIENLAADRFTVAGATSGEEALALARTVRPDVALIDIGLPGMSGFEVVTALREGDPLGPWDPGLAILLVSGRDDGQSIIRGLERGADDYLVKPYDYSELLARVGAQVRRSRGVSTVGVLRIGPLEVDRRAMATRVHGRRLNLSAKEFALLCALARDPHRVVGKPELLAEVWGFSSGSRTRTVDSHASRLRGKLADGGLPGWIRNVWGQGYRLLPEDAS